jgi:hypothetical protein
MLRLAAEFISGDGASLDCDVADRIADYLRRLSLVANPRLVA